jgi:hypothetical protein
VLLVPVDAPIRSALRCPILQTSRLLSVSASRPGGSVVLSLVIAALVATGAVTVSTAVIARGWRLKP